MFTDRERNRKGGKVMSRRRGGKCQATTPVSGTFEKPRKDSRIQQSSHFNILGNYESIDGDWTEINNKNTSKDQFQDCCKTRALTAL